MNLATKLSLLCSIMLETPDLVFIYDIVTVVEQLYKFSLANKLNGITILLCY